MLIAVKNKFIVHSFISPQDVIAKKELKRKLTKQNKNSYIIVLFIVIFGTLSFPVEPRTSVHNMTLPAAAARAPTAID